MLAHDLWRTKQVKNNKYINMTKQRRNYQDITCSFSYQYLPQTPEILKAAGHVLYHRQFGGLCPKPQGLQGGMW